MDIQTKITELEAEKKKIEEKIALLREIEGETKPVAELFNVLPYKPETKEAIVSKTGAIIPNYKNNAIETLKAIEAEAMVLSRTKKGNVETTEEYIGGGPIQSSIKDYYGK